jgi:hypothetical protein
MRGEQQVPYWNPQIVFSLVSHKLLRWLSPVFAVAACGTSIALAAEGSVYLVAALAQGVLLAAGVAGCWPRLRRLRLVGIAHYFCLVHAAAALGILRAFSGRQPTAWRRFSRAPAQLS